MHGRSVPRYNRQSFLCLLTRRQVISFTIALFLSGYVIQQRTLRELRATIRPAERAHRHHIALPSGWENLSPEFLRSRLGDEYEVPDEGYHARKEDITSARLIGNQAAGSGSAGTEQLVLRVTESRPDTEKQRAQESRDGEARVGGKDDSSNARVVDDEVLEATRSAAVNPPESDRRTEGQPSDQSAESTGPDVGTEKPLSRYERRKAIREEIRRLSYNPKPVYYQRRLW